MQQALPARLRHFWAQRQERENSVQLALLAIRKDLLVAGLDLLEPRQSSPVC
jgi:hypothetical protein